MPQTPRLCIDSRTAQEMPQTGFLAQELIDQLVAANGEQEASEWIQKNRTVLLSHPGQVFSGQLRKYETKRKVGNSPFYWLWEKEFVKTAGLSSFHRFRAIDQINAACAITTLTTVLPPRRKLPFFITRRPNQFFCVPSLKDKNLLSSQFEISPERIFISKPSIRRFLHFHHLERRELSKRPLALFIVDSQTDKSKVAKLSRVVKTRFPKWETKTLSLKNKEQFSPQSWKEILLETQACFYLCEKPFDWGSLALECLFYKIPTVFSEENSCLQEILSPLGIPLTRFLIEQPDEESLIKNAEVVHNHLDECGVFDPLGMAHQYRDIYSQCF